jgi:hypothetical protein
MRRPSPQSALRAGPYPPASARRGGTGGRHVRDCCCAQAGEARTSRERRCGCRQAPEGPPLCLQRALQDRDQEEEGSLRDHQAAVRRHYRREAAGRRRGRQSSVDADHRGHPDIHYCPWPQHNSRKRRSGHQRSRALLRPKQRRHTFIDRRPRGPIGARAQRRSIRRRDHRRLRTFGRRAAVTFGRRAVTFGRRAVTFGRRSAVAGAARAAAIPAARTLEPWKRAARIATERPSLAVALATWKSGRPVAPPLPASLRTRP